MNTNKDNISQAIELIYQRQLGRAIKTVRGILADNTHLADTDILDGISHDYQLMLDFMKRGYKDDKREELYNSLLKRLYRLASDMDNAWKRMNVSPYSEAVTIAKSLNTSHEFIRSVLESFVTDAAMLSLENEDTRRAKGKELYSRHQRFMDQLFNSIWTSRQWTKSDRSFYSGLLLSPAIDINDAQLIISAITIGATNNTDPNKLLTLAEIYTNADNEHVRQRALTGLAFALPDRDFSELFPALTDTLNSLLDDSGVRKELLELQMQVFFCMNAEKDNNRIQQDIIPTLMKNNNLKVTRFGITEKEEDPMQDILDPDKADRDMEEVENSIKKMMDMQKAGADIYFGGFSQMKRFPFFTTMSNWLTPFSENHPSLATVKDKIGDTPIMSILFKSGPFCDSDKYSFAFAMAEVIDRIPANMREMMGNASVLGPAMPESDRQSAAYIRRMYLQDLYRFYKLYTRRSGLRNPFENSVVYGFTNPGISFFFVSTLLRNDKLNDEKLKLGKFLMKQRRWDDLSELINSFNDCVPSDNAEYYLLSAYADMNDDLYNFSIEMFQKALEIDPGNILALKGLARACLNDGEYELAEETYAELLKHFPDNKSFMLNRSIALLKTDNIEEAMELLYRMDYESNNDLNVKRVLAWGLLCQKKTEAAKKEYNNILAGGKPKAEDYLNAGYCAWFMNDMARAVELFKTFCEKKTDKDGSFSLEDVLKEDYDMICQYDISDTDMQLVIDMVEGII